MGTENPLGLEDGAARTAARPRLELFFEPSRRQHAALHIAMLDLAGIAIDLVVASFLAAAGTTPNRDLGDLPAALPRHFLLCLRQCDAPIKTAGHEQFDRIPPDPALPRARCLAFMELRFLTMYQSLRILQSVDFSDGRMLAKRNARMPR